MVQTIINEGSKISLSLLGGLIVTIVIALIYVGDIKANTEENAHKLIQHDSRINTLELNDSINKVNMATFNQCVADMKIDIADIKKDLKILLKEKADIGLNAAFLAKK